MIVIYILTGIFIGWVTKIPFVWKWYKELKQTQAYKEAKNGIKLYEAIERHNSLYPDNQIKH